MRQVHGIIKHAVCLISLSVTASMPAYAGGFSLYTEGSVSELSVFAAGSAAEAPDASIGWYNPAGLVLIKNNQALISGVGVFPRTMLTGTSTFTTTDELIDIPPYEQSFTNLRGGRQAGVPAFHLAHPLGERATFGLSVVAPFGLGSDWGRTSPVRYSATLTSLETIDLAPQMGAYLTDNLSIGLGLDIQFARVTFNGVAGSPAVMQYFQSLDYDVDATTLDSTSDNQGNSMGVGFHGGVLAFFNDKHTRVGLNYQSQVQHRFEGESILTGRLADINLTDPNTVYETQGLITNDVSLPRIVTLSGYHEVNSQWALLGSVVYTGWSSFKETELQNVAGYSAELGLQVPLNVVSYDNYRDAWRFALGSTYAVNDRWVLRAGLGTDETPTVNAERSVRLPDTNRWAAAVGTHYQVYPSIAVDLAYVYLAGFGRSPLHKTQVLSETSSNRIDAWAKNTAQLGGIQVTWTPQD
ncbi:MAG: outer membrane protein transport protein [Legionellaceae bacterium]|nr:outer membrane protein transport protein [Legionellaceae bacterium]